MGFLESLAISETIKLSWKGSVKKVPENAKTSRKSRFVQHELHSVLWAKLSFSFRILFVWDPTVIFKLGDIQMFSTALISCLFDSPFESMSWNREMVITIFTSEFLYVMCGQSLNFTTILFLTLPSAIDAWDLGTPQRPWPETLSKCLSQRMLVSIPLQANSSLSHLCFQLCLSTDPRHCWISP